MSEKRKEMQHLQTTEDKWICVKMIGSGQWIKSIVQQ